MGEYRRRSTRLKNYDYTSAGMYFVTMCARDRKCLFGGIINNTMRLNIFGEIVWNEWIRSARIRREVTLDTFIIMPNHMHGIVTIDHETMAGCKDVGAHGRAPLQRKPKSLGSFIAGFKSTVTTKINALRNTPQLSVWQRNYYDHIIRNEADLNRIREYVQTNPTTWNNDKNNPENEIL